LVNCSFNAISGVGQISSVAKTSDRLISRPV
jgi:hypothetical protein